MMCLFFFRGLGVDAGEGCRVGRVLEPRREQEVGRGVRRVPEPRREQDADTCPSMDLITFKLIKENKNS